MKQKRNQIEAKIRDYLASHLNFISDDLQLVQKEYSLKNSFGTRGYIDILARDSFQNSVIIEIKRSDQAARQAIHEVFKYASLLKQNFRIKESELRIIIISTEWRELLVPYSEFYHNTGYSVEAFKIYVDRNDTPIQKEAIQPLEQSVTRNISPNHLIYLYRIKEDMLRGIKLIRKRMKEIGISDFVILELSKEEPKGNVIYPFAAYLAFQRYTKSFYLEILSKDDPDFLGEFEVIEWNSSNDYDLMNSLEELVLSELRIEFYDDMEIGYPEKFVTHIGVWNWKVRNIVKEGFFATDPTLDDKMIIDEIQGLRGGSTTHYSNYSHSKTKARIKEIEQSAVEYLASNDRWLSHIQFAFSDLKQNTTDYDLILEIYNPPESILFTLYKIHNHTKFGVIGPIVFLPNYVLWVNFSDEERTSLVYMGQIKWNGQKPSFDALVERVFKGDASWYVTASFFNTVDRLESTIMRFLGFEYSSDVFLLKDGEIKSIQTIENNTLYHTNPRNSLYINNFVANSKAFLDDLDKIYNAYIVI